jgi:anti-sigma B factor antagonist
LGFQVNTRKAGEVVVIEAGGRLTLTDGHTKLRDQIHVSAGYGTKRFILNLSRVDAIDSYGIGELARCHSAVRQSGGSLKLGGVSPKVLEVLKISHLNTIFEIYPDETEALRAFAAGH